MTPSLPVPGRPAGPEPTTILFVAANPATSARLGLDEEVRLIEDELRMATPRDAFRVRLLSATRPIGLLRGLNRERPAIVHFAGHADAQGIVLADDHDGQVTVSGDMVARLLVSSPQVTRLVVLNACSTEKQCAALVDAVGCVIAMSAPIGDREARCFSQALYAGLIEGRSVQSAFDHAMALLAIHRGSAEPPRDAGDGEAFARPSQPVPVLRHRPDVHPDQIDFTSTARVAQPGAVIGRRILAAAVVTLTATVATFAVRWLTGDQPAPTAGSAPAGAGRVAASGSIDAAPATMAGSPAPSAGQGLSTGGSAASQQAPSQSSEARANGLLLGYRILARAATDADFHVVNRDDTLVTGTRVAFELLVSETAHGFIVQHRRGATQLLVLFPDPRLEIQNPLPANQWIRIPPGDRGYLLDDKDLGTETVFLIASRNPLPMLTHAIQSAQPDRAVARQIVTIATPGRAECVDISDLDDDRCTIAPRGLGADAATLGRISAIEPARSAEPPSGARAAQPRRPRPAAGFEALPKDDIVFVPFSFQHR